MVDRGQASVGGRVRGKFVALPFAKLRRFGFSRVKPLSSVLRPHYDRMKPMARAISGIKARPRFVRDEYCGGRCPAQEIRHQARLLLPSSSEHPTRLCITDWNRQPRQPPTPASKFSQWRSGGDPPNGVLSLRLRRTEMPCRVLRHEVSNFRAPSLQAKERAPPMRRAGIR